MKYQNTRSLKILILTLLIGASNLNTVSANDLKPYSYTAHGSTSIQNAMMFKQLMTSNSNVQILTKFSPISKNKSASSLNYTIKGKTSKRQVKKLIELFKKSQKIEVITSSIPNKSKVISGYANQYSMRYYLYNNYQATYYPSYLPSPYVMLVQQPLQLALK